MKSLFLVMIVVVLSTAAAQAQVTVVAGYTVTQLATGIDRPFVAAGPSINGWTGELYVTTGLTQQIVRIDTAGTVTPFADLSAIVPFEAIFWPSFDLVGNYGGELFVDDDNVTGSPDSVYRVDSGGTGSTFATGPGDDNDAMAFDPFGAFQGSLFLHDGASHATLYKVSSTGVVSAFATAVPDGSRQIAFSPGGGFGPSMYIAGEADGLIYTVPASHTAGQPAAVFAGFQANSGSIDAIGIAISDTGPFGTDVMYVSDENSSTIVTVDVTGQTTGTFVTGLSGATLIDLVRVGDFAGSMVLTDFGDGSIYIVSPIPEVDWEENFAIQADDGAVHPAVLIGLSQGLAEVAGIAPCSIVFSHSGLSPNEPIQLNLASFRSPFYPPDPIRVIGNRIEVDMDQNGTMFTLGIDASSTTGELIDPASIVGFNPQPEPPAGSLYAFDPPPPLPALGEGLGIFMTTSGGAGAPGATQITLTVEILDENDTPLPLALVGLTQLPALGPWGRILLPLVLVALVRPARVETG